MSLPESTHISPERVTRSIQSRFHPLNGLTPQRLVTQLDAFNVGYLGECARTWDAMLRRDDRLPALAQKRYSAIARYGFEVVPIDSQGDAAMEKEAKAHAEVIEYFLNNLTATGALDENERGGFSLMIRQMAEAIGMRYAVHEIVWEPSPEGLSATFRQVPLWFFENRTGKLRFLEQDFGITGIDMPDDEWLVTVGPGIMEASSVCWMYKRLPLRDWLAFSEKFGFPGVLGKTNATKGSPEWDAMMGAVREFANDWASVCNASESIEMIEAKGGTTLPFEPLIDRMDKALAILWRGGDLSTASGKGGGSHAGASLQGDEEDLLEKDDAAWISETLQSGVIRQVIAYHFGAQAKPLAYVQISCEDRKDTRMDLEMFQTLAGLGVPITVSSVLERFSLPTPRPEEELIKPPAGGPVDPLPAITSGQLANEATGKVADSLGVPKSWLSPIEKLLSEIQAKASDSKVSDEDYLAFLQDAQKQLPELLGEMNTEELASVFESALGKSLLEGVRDGLKNKSKTAAS